MRFALPAGRDRHVAIAFVAILVVAVALRVAVFQPYALAHPDEGIQYLEQAHRLVFGFGVEPWEYRYGMRNWLVPLLLSPPMWIGAHLLPNVPAAPVIGARMFAGLIALAPLAAAFALGARLSRLHALVAMAVVAIWVESIFFSVHVLTETLATATFLSAAALIRPDIARGRLAAGGVLLALTVLLRLQYAPAVAVFVLIALNTRWRDWVPVIAGGLAALAAQAVLDAAMGAVPLGWMVENFRQNLVNDRAASFGTAPPVAYIATLAYHWAWALIPILVLVAVVWRRYPALVAAAIANLVVHMAIGHKEYRFIWLTVEILVMLAAIGSAELLRLALDRIGAGPRRRMTYGVALVLVWATVSGALAVVAPVNWRGLAAAGEAAALAGSDRRICAVALDGTAYWNTAYASLRRPIPIYYPEGRLSAGVAAYNAIIAPADYTLPAGYHPRACFDDQDGKRCLFVRAGGCDPDAGRGLLLSDSMRAHDI